MSNEMDGRISQEFLGTLNPLISSMHCPEQHKWEQTMWIRYCWQLSMVSALVLCLAPVFGPCVRPLCSALQQPAGRGCGGYLRHRAITQLLASIAAPLNHGQMCCWPLSSAALNLRLTYWLAFRARGFKSTLKPNTSKQLWWGNVRKLHNWGCSRIWTLPFNELFVHDVHCEENTHQVLSQCLLKTTRSAKLLFVFLGWFPGNKWALFPMYTSPQGLYPLHPDGVNTNNLPTLCTLM